MWIYSLDCQMVLTNDGCLMKTDGKRDATTVYIQFKSWDVAFHDLSKHQISKLMQIHFLNLSH